ncbi:hypothetical protein ACHQM5_022080 [Ranunculus cassubicifolius]
MQKDKELQEIKEEEQDDSPKNNNEESAPLLSAKQRSKSVTTKVPEVEIHLYRQGKGPIEIFKSSLGGWDQDQLEIHEILDKFGFKSVFAFNPQSGRGVPIRFNPKNGRSLLPYRDGSIVYMDGEPKDSLVSPITKILVGIVAIILMLSVLFKENVIMETPSWLKKLNLPNLNIPPWVLACCVVVFTRLRKRIRDFFKK